MLAAYSSTAIVDGKSFRSGHRLMRDLHSPLTAAGSGSIPPFWYTMRLSRRSRRSVLVPDRPSLHVRAHDVPLVTLPLCQLGFRSSFRHMLHLSQRPRHSALVPDRSSLHVRAHDVPLATLPLCQLGLHSTFGHTIRLVQPRFRAGSACCSIPGTRFIPP